MMAVWIAIAAAGVAAVAAVVLVGVATRRRELLTRIAQLDYELDQLEHLVNTRRRVSEAAQRN
mgnify:CR=1 FL=1